MKKKSLWCAKMMARMARDGDVDGLAGIISEMMEEPEEAVPSAGDPLVRAVVSAVEENLEEEKPAAAETPGERTVRTDCGPEILEALQTIITLLSGPAADRDGPGKNGDAEPSAVEEAVAEAAAEKLAGNLVEAAAEAVAEVLDPDPEPAGDEEDPVEALVAEILGGEGAAGPDPEEAFSAVLEPETEQDGEEDPEDSARAADALRAALAGLRPQLRKLSPKERQRFNTDVAARMRKLAAKQASGRPGPYAALRQASARDASGRDLGRRIMAARNANLRNRPNL